MNNHEEMISVEEMRRKMGEQTQAFMKRQQEKAVRNFRILNRTAIKGGVLFTGSSLMEMFPICEMALSAGITIPIYNRGIGGTTTDDFLREIDAVLLGLKPSKVFINIGTNDMNSARYGENWMDRLIKNYEEILRIASEKIPEAEFYLMAYYPANLHLPWQTPESISWMVDRTPENIAECNRRVQALAEKFNMHYIDVNDGLCDENGEQKAEFAMDGVHMYANGYEIVFNNLRPYLQ